MTLDLSFKENFIHETKAEKELYDVGSMVRNVCFVLGSGQSIFFNYAYLVSVELTVTDQVNTLTVNFTSQSIVLKGYNLQGLFEQLMSHIPKIIVVTNIRYVTDTDIAIGVVTEITLQKRNATT